MSATVGIIGGGGWLGGAIAERGLSEGVLSETALIVSSRSPRGKRLADYPGVTWTADNAELARRSDVVILSVRPEQFGDLALDLRGKLVISVMAGISMATLERKVKADRIVRSMPNAAAEIGKSYTPWFASKGTSAADRAFIVALFSSCGEHDEVEAEHQIDFLTGVSGPGPAYPALLAKALLHHAKASGIPAHIATRAVRGVIRATQLMESGTFNPAETVDTFLAYRGVSAAGLATMVEKGLPDAVGAGLTAAASAAAAMAKRYDT